MIVDSRHLPWHEFQTQEPDDNPSEILLRNLMKIEPGEEPGIAVYTPL